MTKTIQLRECPFCDSPAHLEGTIFKNFAVLCTSQKCFASLGESYSGDEYSPDHQFDSAEAAAAAWNARPRLVLYGMPMDEIRARELLAGVLHIGGSYCHPDALNTDKQYASWSPDHDDHSTARIDGHFTPDQLEAVAWWVRNKRAAR